MEEIKTINSDTSVSFREKHSIGIRAWHWISYLCITSLFMTVAASSYVFNTKDNVAFVQQNIQESGGTINARQARSVAHAYNDKVWNWHKNIGVILSCLFAFRLIVEIFTKKEEKFITRLKRGIQLLRLGGPDAKDTKHYLMVKFIYTGFYALITVVIITGLILTYADDVAFFKSIEHTTKDVHNFLMYITITFVVVHIVGVLRAELGKHKGVVSDMFNGGKSN